MIKPIKFSLPEFCLLLWYLSSSFKAFHKISRCFLVCFHNLADEKWVNFCKFLDAAYLILQVTNKPKIWPHSTIEKHRISLYLPTPSHLLTKNSLTVKTTRKWKYEHLCSSSDWVKKSARSFPFSILPWNLEQIFAAAAKTFKIHVC